MPAPAASAMFRKVVRRQQLQSAEHALKSIVKLSAVVPFYGAGHTGLRKFLQHQVPLFRFNTPTLATQFSNAKEKETPTVLKLEKSDGKVVELTVKAMKEEDIVKLVLQADTA